MRACGLFTQVKDIHVSLSGHGNIVAPGACTCDLLSVCLCLSLSLSVCLSLFLSLLVSLSLSVCLSVCLSLSLSLSLSLPSHLSLAYPSMTVGYGAGGTSMPDTLNTRVWQWATEPVSVCQIR